MKQKVRYFVSISKPDEQIWICNGNKVMFIDIADGPLQIKSYFIVSDLVKNKYVKEISAAEVAFLL